MKQKILPFVVTLFIVSCVKETQIPKIDPTRVYFMKYTNGDQSAKTRVANDTLRIDFQEKIILLVDPNDFKNTWGMALIEDFSNSYLKGLHFTALATENGYSYDWVPVNLNDVAPGQKTSRKVTVDGKKYVEVTISRLFEFFKKMGTAQAALSEQNALLQRTNDAILYKTFYAYDGVFSLSNDGSFKVVYSK